MGPQAVAANEPGVVSVSALIALLLIPAPIVNATQPDVPPPRLAWAVASAEAGARTGAGPTLFFPTTKSGQRGVSVRLYPTTPRTHAPNRR